MTHRVIIHLVLLTAIAATPTFTVGQSPTAPAPLLDSLVAPSSCCDCYPKLNAACDTPKIGDWIALKPGTMLRVGLDVRIAEPLPRLYRITEKSDPSILPAWVGLEGHETTRVWVSQFLPEHESVRSLSDALQHQPGDIELLRARGRVELTYKRFNDSIADMDAVLRINPRDADSYYCRARAYTGLAQDQNATGNDQLAISSFFQDERAFGDLFEAIRLDSSRAEFFLERARTSARLGYFQRAIADYTVALGLHAEEKPILLERAAVSFRINEYSNSIKDYDSVLCIEADNLLARLGRASSLIQAEGSRFSDAEADLIRAIQLLIACQANSQDPLKHQDYKKQILEAHLKLAFVLESRPDNDKKESLGQYSCITSNNSGFIDPFRRILSEAYLGRARIYKEDQHKPYEAISDYNEVLKLEPGNVKALTGLARTRLSLKEPALSLDSLNELVQANPRDTSALVEHAKASTNLGHFVIAIADYDVLLAINPRDSQAYLGRARAWKGQGNRGQALTDYDTAIRLEPTLRDARSERMNLALSTSVSPQTASISASSNSVELISKNFADRLKLSIRKALAIEPQSKAIEQSKVTSDEVLRRRTEMLQKTERRRNPDLPPPNADFRPSVARPN